MPILTKEVEVKLWGANIKHFFELGYKGKQGDIITVNIEQLPKKSHAKVEILCDMCNQNKMIVRFDVYNRVVDDTGSYVCKECSQEKRYQTNIKKYGEKIPSKTDVVKEKVRQTNLKHFGVEYYAQTKECLEKMQSTTIDRYGVPNYSQTQEYKEKYHNTCVEKYGEFYRQQFVKKSFESFYQNTGYNHPLQSPEVKEKVKQTFLDHYGVDNPNKNLGVRAKTASTLYANSSQKSSRQQRYICDLYQGILNYPIKNYNVDIYLSDNNLVIEYDGGGHMLNVVTGRKTMKEYIQKEIIRNNIIKREGYKQIKIIAYMDKLPSDQILLQMLNDARQYFSSTNHSWMNFDIDNSKMMNAENKDSNGVFYDYGELRTIKEVV